MNYIKKSSCFGIVFGTFHEGVTHMTNKILDNETSVLVGRLLTMEEQRVLDVLSKFHKKKKKQGNLTKNSSCAERIHSSKNICIFQEQTKHANEH